VRVRRRRTLIAALVIFSVVISVAYVTVGETVSRASLSHSVAAKVGSDYFGSCHQQSGPSWMCVIATSDGTNIGIAYAVTDRGRCWQGTRVSAGGLVGLPERISGCIGPLDQLRLDTHFQNGTSNRRPGFY
jgi:hypothetical protein